MTDQPPSRANISVSLPVPLIKRLDLMATELSRSRSNTIAILLDQALNPVATVTTTSGASDAVTTTVITHPDDCSKGGKHDPKSAKSGSGIIGCSKCQAVKRPDGTWVARS